MEERNLREAAIARAKSREMRRIVLSIAQFLFHPVVDGVHMIDGKAVKDARNRLTIKMGGVKP